jgi:rhodanese-related sulfurtransferase
MNNSVPWKSGLWRLVRNAVLIAILASALGLALNSRLLWKVFTGRAVVSSQTSPETGGELALPLPVELEEVRELLDGDALPIDARSLDAYLEGHLPGARSLPREQIDEQLDAFREQVPPDRPLIIYCSGYGCPDSFVLAERLLAVGYRDVRVYEGGLPEWSNAGLPVERGQR